jgi:hypothetical protein
VVSQAVREVSSALGNTPAVARSSYIDPRVITLFESGRVIELPRPARLVAAALENEVPGNDVVVELPTDIDGDAVRLEIEQRVRTLLLGAGATVPAAATQTAQNDQRGSSDEHDLETTREAR